MAKELPYFKFFTGEWANGTITLEDYAVQGVFINCCCYYWSNEGQVTEKQLRKKIRSDKQINVLIDEDIIKLDGEFVTIKFLDLQLVEREEKSRKASEAGKKSAEMRATKKQQVFNERSTDVEIVFNKKSTNNKEIKRREEKDKKKIREEDLKTLFNEFWNLYDKKTSREKCLKKFMTLTDEEINTLFEHVPRYVASTPDKKYRKDPSTYLNNKSFNDEIIQSNGKSNSKGGFKERIPDGYDSEIF